MKKMMKRMIIGFVFVCLIIQHSQPAYAQINASMTKSKDNNYRNNRTISTNTEFNHENVKEFVDEYFRVNMSKYHVPGLAIAVVEGNKELYKAGYGVSSMETQKPMDPDKTTFPAASVSKLFTATAIMQLYQQGTLDLNVDIRKYLNNFNIKNPYKEAITCQNLLTHSSGLDEQSELDQATLDRNHIKSPDYYFKKHIPRVIIRPNTVCRYSNMGYNLLGYIVEKTSGISYENYVTDHILHPLEMTNSSIRIEDENLADGYEFSGGKFQKDPFAYQYISGSSGVITTVKDMENFMIMHLNHGQFRNKIILDPDTEQMMQNKQFANHDVFDGMGEGFIRDSRNGVQILKHEGALPGYTTTMILLPDQKIGVYVATNTLCGMIFDFEEAFFDHFLGKYKAEVNQSNSSYDLSKYIGTYRSYDGVAAFNISKIFASLDETSQLKVKQTSDGTLKVLYYDQSKARVTTKLICISDGVFTREDGKGYFVFRQSYNNNVDYAFYNVSHQAYKKLGKFETVASNVITLLALIILLLVISLIILIRKIRHKQINNKRIWTLVCLSNILYILGFIGTLGLELYMIFQYDYRLISIIYIFLTLLILAVALQLIEAVGIVQSMIYRKINRAVIIKLIFVQVVQTLFVILLGYNQMIGYHIY